MNLRQTLGLSRFKSAETFVICVICGRFFIRKVFMLGALYFKGS